MDRQFQHRRLCFLVGVGINLESPAVQHELQSSRAEWAYKNVFVEPLMKGSEYNYQPEILNSSCAINTLQSEFCSVH